MESSYRKGGINACIGEQEVSKETVMNKLHTLEFPLLEPLKEKRRVCISMQMKTMFRCSILKKRVTLKSPVLIPLCQSLSTSTRM